MVGLWSPIVCEDGIAVIGATVQILFMLEDSSDDLSSFRRKIMLNIAKLDIKHSLTIFQRSKFNVESVNFVIGSTDNHSCHGHRMSRNEANAARLILRCHQGRSTDYKVTVPCQRQHLSQFHEIVYHDPTHSSYTNR